MPRDANGKFVRQAPARAPDPAQAAPTSTPAGDPLRRGLRSLAQVAFVQALCQLYNAFATVDLTADQLAAITLVATPLISFLQNWLEDNTAFPSIMKSPPSTGQNPV